MRCLVTRLSDGTLPVGGVQYPSLFIDKIMPAHRGQVFNLKEKERVKVRFCPFKDDGHGFDVEVYRCPGAR